jgi:hypothetical protein
MTLWDFLFQASVWHWFGFLLFVVIVVGSICNVLLSFSKRPVYPIPPQYVKCMTCKFCRDDSSCVTGQWVFNKTRVNDEKKT